MIIFKRKIVDSQRSLSRCEVHRNAAVWNCGHPEQPAFSYPRIEIVDLQVLSGTCEDVKSYKGECAVMVCAIVTNEFAAHEAQVRFKDQMLRGLAGRSVRARSADRSPADEAVEI